MDLPRGPALISEMVGWIEVDGKEGEPIDWNRHPVLNSLRRHRLACLSARLNELSDVCATEVLEADVDQLWADLEAEFEQLLKVAA